MSGKAPSSLSSGNRDKREWTAQIDKILALYARGMTTRDIEAQLQELYGVEVSPTLISKRLLATAYACLLSLSN